MSADVPSAWSRRGRIGFPIETSRVALDLSSGTIAHSRGISLAKGSSSLTLSDFDIRLGESPALAPSVNAGKEKAEILTLGLSARERPPTGAR